MKAVTIMLSASVVVKYAKVQLTSLNGEDLSVMRRRDTPRAQRSSDEARDKYYDPQCDTNDEALENDDTPPDLLLMGFRRKTTNIGNDSPAGNP